MPCKCGYPPNCLLLQKHYTKPDNPPLIIETFKAMPSGTLKQQKVYWSHVVPCGQQAQSMARSTFYCCVCQCILYCMLVLLQPPIKHPPATFLELTPNWFLNPSNLWLLHPPHSPDANGIYPQLTTRRCCWVFISPVDCCYNSPPS